MKFKELVEFASKHINKPVESTPKYVIPKISVGRVELSDASEIIEEYNRIINSMGTPVGFPSMPDFTTHLGQVKILRKQFKQYTKTEFRNLSKSPMIKDILKEGVTKLNAEQIAERIKEHLDNIDK